MGLSKRRILVVGGGLIGAGCAVALAQAGAEIVLVDPGVERARASFGNAGQIVIESVEPLASWSQVSSAPGRLFLFGGPLDFRVSDADLWLPWALAYLRACAPARFKSGTLALGQLLERAIPAWRALADAIGRPELIQAKGYYHLWESEAAVRRGLAQTAHTNQGSARWRPIEPSEIERLQAVFAGRPKGGVYFENTAKLADPGLTVKALHQALSQSGGEILEDSVQRLEETAKGVRAMLASGVGVEADQVLIAAGARSSTLMRQLGLHAPLVAERGYHLHFTEHAWPDDLEPVLFSDRFIYMTCFLSGARATSFTEIGRPDSPPDPRKWRALRRQIRALGMPVQGDGVEWMGSRPTLPDFLPAIGRASARVLYAFGHQHIGATLAAATAEAVVELMATEHTPDRLRPFDIARFS